MSQQQTSNAREEAQTDRKPDESSWYVYCDESSQTAARYMCLGSLWIRGSNYTEFIQAYDYVRSVHGLGGRIKWGKVSWQYESKYRAFVNIFLKLSRRGAMRFCAMVLDASKFDHKTYNENDPELGYYKFFSYLLSYRIPDPASTYHVVMDRRTNKVPGRLAKLKEVVNHMAYRRHGRFPLVRTIEARSLAETPGLQMNDVLLGALQYMQNDRHLQPNANEGKVMLSRYLATQLWRRNLGDQTAMNERRFNVWHFRLSPRATEKRPNP